MKKRRVGRSSSVASRAAAVMTMLVCWTPMTAVVSSFSHIIVSSQHTLGRNWMTASIGSSSAKSGLQTSRRRSLNSHLFYTSSFSGDSHDENMASMATRSTNNNGQTSSWQLANDFDMFLNQCSIQSLLFQLETASSSQRHDSQTAQWVERFTRPMTTTCSLLDYHGLAAMNTALFPTWDSYFIQLLQEAPVSVEEEAIMPKVTTAIYPASLCSRLLLTRQEISAEFVKELGAIADMGDYTMRAYWDKASTIPQQQTSHCEQQHTAQDSSSNSNGDMEFNVRRENLKLLKLPPDCTREQSQPSCPFHKRNSDLLLLLTTHEAIHRVLNGKTASTSTYNSGDSTEQQQDDSSSSSWKKSLSRMQRRRQRRLNRNVHYQKNALVAHHHASNMEYLQRFYRNRYHSHFFSGSSQEYGRADAFMAELLAELPTITKLSSSVINDKDNDDEDDDDSSDDDDATPIPTATSSLINHLIDPTRIAQLILDMRRDVALEWAQLARQVPEQHLAKIKRLELNALINHPQGSGFFDTMSSGHTSNHNSVGGATNGRQQGGAAMAGGSSSVGDSTMESFEKALRAMTNNVDHHDHDACTDPTNPHVLMVKNLPTSAAAAAVATTNTAAGQVGTASIPNVNNKDISQ